MRERIRKDFTEHNPEDEAQSGASSRKKHKKKKSPVRSRVVIRVLIVVAVIGLLAAVIVNWRAFAPDSFVSWMEDVLDGTTGGDWPVAITGDAVFDLQQAGGNLVVLTDTDTVYFNSSGGESLRRACAYAKPMMRVSGRYVLVLETGGERYRLETRSGIECEQEVGNTLRTGAVSPKGDVAVVTDSSQSHVSEVVVYDRDGDRRYQWLSSEWLVMDASFAGDGNSLAVVGCRAQNGAMQSAILVFDLRDGEAQPRQYIGDRVLYSRVQYMDSGTVAAVGDTQARFVNPTGALDTTVSYTEVELIGFCLTESEAALVTRPFGSQDGGTVTAYSSSGDKRCEQALEGAFRDVSAGGDGFLVLTDRYVYNLGKEGLRANTAVSADSLMVGSIDKRALVLGMSLLNEVIWE